MTHASVPPEERVRLGITDNLIRLSIGLEDERDLLLDIQQALDKAVRSHSFLSLDRALIGCRSLALLSRLKSSRFCVKSTRKKRRTPPCGSSRLPAARPSSAPLSMLLVASTGATRLHSPASSSPPRPRPPRHRPPAPTTVPPCSSRVVTMRATKHRFLPSPRPPTKQSPRLHLPAWAAPLKLEASTGAMTPHRVCCAVWCVWTGGDCLHSCST